MNIFKTAALAFAASGTVLIAAPAAAYEMPASHHTASPADADEWNQYRDRGDWGRDRSGRYDRYDRNDRYDRDDRRARYSRGREEYVSRNTRTWRGRDGNQYCEKSDGTTGLIIGGAAGALLGREIDGGRNRTLGTILGAAGGALLGKEIDGGRRCR